MKEKLKIIAELAKVKITVAVSLTTVAGFVLYYHGFSVNIILPTLGTFFLACGSSVINHIQEYKTDMLMERTHDRPLPSSRVTKSEAWTIALLFVVSGSVILWFTSNVAGFFLGLLALVWYNLIYTNLKRVTYYAVIPGSFIGSIPPLIGWVTAGGPLIDYRTLAIGFFFFVWQVPHFWLLMLKYGKQYKNAGFPSITDKPQKVIKTMTFVWVVTTAISAIFLLYFKVILSNISSIGIIFASAWLVYQFLRLEINNNNLLSPGKYFMKINYYVLSIIIFLITDHIFYSY